MVDVMVDTTILISNNVGFEDCLIASTALSRCLWQPSMFAISACSKASKSSGRTEFIRPIACGRRSGES
jgi:hypothetical protein